MRVTLDGKELFGEQSIFDVGSIARDSIERTVAGLDGVVSVDLGKRSRNIEQSGVLRATSREQLEERIEEISTFLDGTEHSLATDGKGEFENVRMNSFKVAKAKLSGAGITAEYKIVYTQLMV